MSIKKYKFNPLIIALYMVPALGWWANLLWIRNTALYAKDMEILQLKHRDMDPKDLAQLTEYQTITKKRESGKKMILGEGSVIFLGLIGGLLYVYRSYRRELDLSTRQQNFQLSITHELKTPITGMQLIFDTIKRHQNLPTETLVGMAEAGKKESIRLLGMVNDILLSEQLANKWEPNKRMVSIQKIAAECVLSAQVLYPQTVFEVDVDSHSNEVFCDEQGLRHILINLLENAAKYSPLGKKVILSTKIEGEQTHIRVSDEGEGIALAEREKVFQKFYRVGREETRQTKGTGLGLFVVKQIVEAHGGKINILTNKPQGAIFDLSL
jgi:two-component system, OmpR family, phosphate regulon sensor histidine kinase PhoR